MSTYFAGTSTVNQFVSKLGWAWRRILYWILSLFLLFIPILWENKYNIFVEYLELKREREREVREYTFLLGLCQVKCSFTITLLQQLHCCIRPPPQASSPRSTWPFYLQAILLFILLNVLCIPPSHLFFLSPYSHTREIY